MSRTPDPGAPPGAHGRVLVRPRRVWGGLLVALLGLALGGLGVVLLSWWISLVGIAGLVAGAGVSLAGGALYDAVPALAPARELRAVRTGDVHEGVAPGAMASHPLARDEAAEVSQTARELHAATRRPVGVRWAPVAGWMLVLIASILLVSQWELVAPTTTGRSNSLRDTGLLVALGLSGLRLGFAAGRQVTATAISGLAGLGLFLGGALASHEHAALTAIEVAGGILAVLCSSIAVVSPTQKADLSRGH